MYARRYSALEHFKNIRSHLPERFAFRYTAFDRNSGYNQTQIAVGFTLIELLAVLGIIAILAGIAVPTFIRLGNTSTLDMNSASRDLQSLLRAARQYAITHNVPTAIAYTMANRVDSVTNNTVTILEGFGMVRGLTQTEDELLVPLEIPGLKDADQGLGLKRPFVFIPVFASEADFRRMRESVCIQEQWQSQSGVTGIEIINPETNTLYTNPEGAYLGSSGDLAQTNVFPAHVFTPQGTLRLAGGSRLRFELHVGPSPDLSRNYRFASDNTPLPPVIIELYATLGKVRIAS